MRKLCVAFILILCVACAGCSSANFYHAEDKVVLGGGKVAVIPFESLSGDPNSGIVLAGLLENELQRYRMPGLILREDVSAKLALLEGETRSPAQLGELLGAKWLVVGQVTEYRYKRGVGEEPLIALCARMISAGDGRVVWSADISEIGHYSWFAEDSLGRLSSAVARKLAESLNKNILVDSIGKEKYDGDEKENSAH